MLSCSVHKSEHDAAVLTPKISPWRGGWGEFLDDEYSKKSCLPSSTEPVLFVWICIQVRVLFTGEGKREGGIFFFPIMHQQQDPNWHRGLGSFSRDKHPVSCLTPSKGNLPGTSIHRSTHARCLLEQNQRPQRPKHSSPRSWPATRANDPTSSVFSRSFRFPWLPSLTCQWLSGTAETTVAAALRKGYKNSCWQMKNSCSVTIYLSIPPASSFPSHSLSFSLSGWCTDDRPVSTAHMGLGDLLSLICGRILMWCVLSEMDQ